MTTTETPTPLTRTVDGTEVPAAGTYALDVSHSSVELQRPPPHGVQDQGPLRRLHRHRHHRRGPARRPPSRSTIQAASVDTRDETRDGHLRSADFFDAERPPDDHLPLHRVTPAGKGTLDRRRRAHRAGHRPRPCRSRSRFEGGAKDPWGGARVGFTARTELDRDAFGLSWNQALETGGVLVGNRSRSTSRPRRSSSSPQAVGPACGPGWRNPPPIHRMFP